VPKIITAKRRETDVDRAQEYVRTHILLPSALIGMVFMIAGALALIYQFMSETFGWHPFAETSGLLAVGIMAGWGQTLYHRFLLQHYPSFFANRMKLFSRGPLKRPKRDTVVQTIEHPGRNWVPLAYVGGILLLLSASFAAAAYGHLYFVAAFFMPWAGFFWAKMFFWRKVLPRAGG
jgi:hypothetical protein